MKLMKKKKGFTIVELVIVIGVIGILAGILIPTFVNVNQKAEEAALKSNLANAYSAYVADAADGIVEDEKAVEGWAENAFTIKLIEQSKAVLVKGSDQYSFNTSENVWAKRETAIAAGDLVMIATKVATDEEVIATYGGFAIYSEPTA